MFFRSGRKGAIMLFFCSGVVLCVVTYVTINSEEEKSEMKDTEKEMGWIL